MRLRVRALATERPRVGSVNALPPASHVVVDQPSPESLHVPEVVRHTRRHIQKITLANHNNDIAEYWEWSAEGLYSQDRTGYAYRLGSTTTSAL